MRATNVAPVFVGLLLCSTFVEAQGPFGNDWLAALLGDIENANANIQRNVHQLNRRIQEDTRARLAEVGRLADDFRETIVTGNGATAGSNSNVVINGNNGGSARIIYAGRTSDGQPYLRDVENKVVGDEVRHFERIHDPKTNTTKEYGYTLDLKDPNAKPVPFYGPSPDRERP